MMNRAGRRVVIGRDHDFGERLRALIQARYKSLRQFALEIEMEPTYLSRILNGHVSVPDPPTIRRIAKGLDMAPDTLRQLTGIAEPVEEGQRDDLPAIADVMAYIERDPEIVAKLAHLKATQTPATYQRIVRALAEAWQSNGRMMLATWDAAVAARPERDEARDDGE